MTITRKPNPRPAAANTHIYLLLDRSGSMESIRPDVIGGYNAFIEAQRTDGHDARVTLVQFDTADSQEVVLDRARIDRVPLLTEATFVPRGGTPLFDATGLLIARAAKRATQRARAGKAAEDIMIVTITDGEENSSREFTGDAIKALVQAREADGWTFVYLSAAIDAYANATAIGYDARSVQAFAPTGAGAAAAFSSLSEATVRRRGRVRAAAPYVAADFFEGQKPAEATRPPTR